MLKHVKDYKFPQKSHERSKRSYRTEPRHDKTNKVTVRPAKTQISQADLSLRWAHTHFVGFVMSRLRSLWCIS